MKSDTAMRYEYKVLTFEVKGIFGGKVDPSAMEQLLNRLGAEGWELKKISEVLREVGVTTKLIAFLQRSA